MTSNDDGSGHEKPAGAKPRGFPSLKSAAARRVRYDEPRRFVEHGKERFERDVIEIDVQTDAEFDIAGTGPALFVGATPVLDSRRVGERHYRFFAPGSLPLADDAPLALGKAGSGVPTPVKKSPLRLRWVTQR